LRRRHPRNPIKVGAGTQPRNEGTYETLEALEVIDRTKSPDERTVHGQCAGRTCPMKDGRAVRRTAKSTEVERG
jgi:hypothetical protein